MRLIDADELKEKLSQQWFIDILLAKTSSNDMFSALSDVIDSQLTTYDVDSVVKQLEELRKECEEPLQDYDPNYFIGKAIEIVKAGGNS